MIDICAKLNICKNLVLLGNHDVDFREFMMLISNGAHKAGLCHNLHSKFV